MRRLAAAIGCPADEARVIAEVAAEAGLLSAAGGARTGARQAWRTADGPARLRLLLSAWWRMERSPLSGHGRDAGETVARIRRAIFGVLAGIPEGRCFASLPELIQTVRWRAPLLDRELVAGLTPAILAEAGVLGLVAGGALTELGRALAPLATGHESTPAGPAPEHAPDLVRASALALSGDAPGRLPRPVPADDRAGRASGTAARAGRARSRPVEPGAGGRLIRLPGGTAAGAAPADPFGAARELAGRLVGASSAGRGGRTWAVIGRMARRLPVAQQSLLGRVVDHDGRARITLTDGMTATISRGELRGGDARRLVRGDGRLPRVPAGRDRLGGRRAVTEDRRTRLHHRASVIRAHAARRRAPRPARALTTCPNRLGGVRAAPGGAGARACAPSGRTTVLTITAARPR